MSDARWAFIQDLFFTARELPPEGRDAHLLARCPADTTVRDEVKRLLAAESVEGILDRAAPVFLVSTDDPAPIRERAGPYLIVGEIGRGGMGIVYRAYDPRLRRDVALKFLPAAYTREPGANARFLDEARAASALDHPHTCPIYDIGTSQDGRWYMAMAYCAGGSLAERVAAGPLSAERAVRIAVQVASALDRAHGAGIVHRDIKPANIAFTEHDDARVLDFGVAVLGTGEWESPTVAAGTPAYMAPEQVRGDAVDARTDVWALGAVLFEMVTGRRAFTGSRSEVTTAILTGAVEDAHAVCPDVPPALSAAIAKALARAPADRFATAAELAAAIESAIARPSARPRPTARRLTRIVLAAMVVLVAAGGVWAAQRFGRSRASPTSDPGAVAILPFRVSGDASLDYLREGMVDLLDAKLTGEGGFRSVDARAVYATLRRLVSSDAVDLPIDSALTVARLTGAGNILVGEIVGSPSALVVNTSIRNAHGSVVARATVQGSHGDLSAVVDRLVAQLLTAGSGEEPQRLASLTSASLPALRAYLEGQAAYRRGRYVDAVEHFGRALDLDSTFAVAGLSLSLADGWVGTGHARNRGRRVAWRWRERLSPRDRALLTAHVGPSYPASATVRQRLEATESALRLAPDRLELWYELGDLHYHYGRVMAVDDWELQAERAFRRALASDSTFAPTIHHLIGLYARARRHDELRAIIAATATAGIEGATADFIRWRSALALGGKRLDRAALDSMSTDAIGWIALVSQDDGVDRMLGEHAVGLRAARPATRAERLERDLGVHSVALNAGRPSVATALTASLRDLQPDSAFHLRLRVLSALYGDGDLLVAGQAANALARTPGDDLPSHLNRCVLDQWRLAHNEAVPNRTTDIANQETDTDSAYSTLKVCEAAADAMRATRQRDPDAARTVARLDAMLRSGPTDFYYGDGAFDHASIALSRALEASGDPRGALSALRRRPYFIGWQPFLAASLRDEGRLAMEVGDREGAIRAYEHFLALRHDPEPSLRPLTDSVRTELARLR